jgi:hypothetical protein
MKRSSDQREQVMENKRIGLIILAGILLCLVLGGYRVLESKSEHRIIPGQEVALGYGIDPHLFLTLESISLQDGDSHRSRLSMTVQARNTGVEVRFNLADLRFAIQEQDRGYSGYEVTSWTTGKGNLLEGSLLLPGQRAKGEIRLLLPAKLDSSAIIIWREADWYKWVPLARKSVLNHRLRVEMSEIIKAAA